MQECRHLILATVTAVNDSQIVYPNCTTCYTKLLRDGEKNRWCCYKCEQFYDHDKVEWRFRLSLTITDGSTLSSVCGFGTNLQQYFGMTAEKFKKYLDHIDVSGRHGNMEEIILTSLKQTFIGQCFYFGFKTTSKQGTCLKDIEKTTLGIGKTQYGKEKVNHLVVYQIIPSTNLEFYTVFEAINNILKTEKGNGLVHLEQSPFCANSLNMKKLNSPAFNTSVNNRNKDICNGSTNITCLSTGSFGQETALLSCDMSSEYNNASDNYSFDTSSKDCDKMQNNAGSFLMKTRILSERNDVGSVDIPETVNSLSKTGQKSKSQMGKENSRECCSKCKCVTKTCTCTPYKSYVCRHGSQLAEVFGEEISVNTVTDQLDFGSESLYSDVSPLCVTPPPKQDLFSTSLNNSSLMLACDNCEEQTTQMISFSVKKPEVPPKALQSIVKEFRNTTSERCDSDFNANGRRISGCEKNPVTYGNHSEMKMTKENFVRQNIKNLGKGDKSFNKNLQNASATVQENFTSSQILIKEIGMHNNSTENLDSEKDEMERQVTLLPESEDIYAYLDVDATFDFDEFSVKETSIRLPSHASQGISTQSPLTVKEKPEQVQNVLADSLHNKSIFGRSSIGSFQNAVCTDHIPENQNNSSLFCTETSKNAQDECGHIESLNTTDHSSCWSGESYSLDEAIIDSQIVGDGIMEKFNFLLPKDSNINNIESDSKFVLKETDKTNGKNCKTIKHAFSSVRKESTDTKPEPCHLDISPGADDTTTNSLDIVARESESDSGLTLTNEKVWLQINDHKSFKMSDTMMKSSDVDSLLSSNNVNVQLCEQEELLPEVLSQEMFSSYVSSSVKNDQETLKDINIQKAKLLSPIVTIPWVPAGTPSSSVCDIVHESCITESITFDNSCDLFNCTENRQEINVCNSSSLNRTRNQRCRTSLDLQNGSLIYSAIPRVKGVKFAKRLSCIKTVPLIDIEMRMNRCARLLSPKVPKSCLKKRKSIVASENLLPVIHATPLLKDGVTCISQDLFLSQPSCNKFTPDTTCMSQNLFTPSPGSDLSCVDCLMKSSGCDVKRSIKFIFPTGKLISKTMASTPKREFVTCSSSRDASLYSSPLMQTVRSNSESLFADSFDDVIANVSSQVENVTHETEGMEPQRGYNERKNGDGVNVKRKMGITDVNSPDLFGDSWTEVSDITNQISSLHDLPVKRLFLD